MTRMKTTGWKPRARNSHARSGEWAASPAALPRRASLLRKSGLAVLGVLFAGAAAFGADATMEWSGQNLVIYGGTDGGSYVKRLGEGETLTANKVSLGTEKGSATLAATGATISVTGDFIVGHEASPGYSDLTARLEIENTKWSCGMLYMGLGVDGDAGTRDGNERVQIVLGKDSVATVGQVQSGAKPWARLRFQGGRLVFPEGRQAVSTLFCATTWTWKGNYPNNGHTVMADGGPIDIELATERRLAGGYAGRSIFLEGTGGLVKRGAGTLVWGWFRSANDGHVRGDASYTGDTVVKAGGIRLATPCSEAGKEVRFSIPPKSPLVVEEGAFFDFAGNDAAWVSVSGAGFVTNSTERACTVTVGTGDADCSFTPAQAGGALNVAKTGSGTLTLASLDLPGTLTVSSGTAVVTAGSTLKVARIVVAAGATLDFRGAKVACTAFDAARGAQILRDASSGFEFDAAVDVPQDGAATRIGGSWSGLRKTGAGTLTLLGACAKASGAVVVAEGTLAVEPAASFAGKYIRFNYRKSARELLGGTTGYFPAIGFSEFSLYGVDGACINGAVTNYTPLKAASTQKYGGFGGIDDARKLAENELAVWMPKHTGFFQVTKWDDKYFEAEEDRKKKIALQPLNVFDGNPDTALVNVYHWDDSDCLVFRLPETTADAIGFTFTTSDDPGMRPTEWRVDGSVDGINWTPLARHEYAGEGDTDAAWYWRTNSTPATARTEYNGGVPYLLDKLEADPAVPAFGTASVLVAKGATLDLRSEKMRLGHLSVDVEAGGGTITRFTPEPDGILDLTAQDLKTVRAGFEVPLTIKEVANAKNFASWTVRVNGKAKKNLRPAFENGKLVIRGAGFALIVR